MDPIEKLLSELTPTRAPGGLDQTMIRIFDRADRNARLRRAARSLTALGAVLAIGLVAGYHLGADSVPPAPAPTVTYLVPLEDSAPPSVTASIPSAMDRLASRSRMRSGSIAVTIIKKDTV